MILRWLSYKPVNFILTIVLGVVVLFGAHYFGVSPASIGVLFVNGIFFALKIALDLLATRKAPVSPLAWGFNAFSSAVLFYLIVYAIGLNQRAWSGSVQSTLGVDTLDTILWWLVIIAGLTMLARPIVRALPRQGIKLSTLWLILFMSIFSALCSYLYPRNGMLMSYDDWRQAGMPLKPTPSAPAFWQPFLPSER